MTWLRNKARELREAINWQFVIGNLCFITAGFIMDRLGTDGRHWQFWAMLGVLVVLGWSERYYTRQQTIDEIVKTVEEYKDEQEN